MKEDFYISNLLQMNYKLWLAKFKQIISNLKKEALSSHNFYNLKLLFKELIFLIVLLKIHTIISYNI